jgi:hypothetical protein
MRTSTYSFRNSTCVELSKRAIQAPWAIFTI